jgi:hypothetical protein
MAGEWRDQSLMVADGPGRHRFTPVIQSGDRAVCALNGFCCLQAIGQLGQTNRTYASGQRGCFACPWTGKKSANIDQGVFNPGQANISAASEMHLEVIAQRERAEMLFEADPWRRSEGTAAGGHHASFGRSRGAAMLRAQIAAGSGESLGHLGVEMKTTEAQGGTGKVVTHSRPAGFKPSDTAPRECGLQQFAQLQTGARWPVQSGDKFAAHTVAWIRSGFDQADRNVSRPQTEPKR